MHYNEIYNEIGNKFANSPTRKRLAEKCLAKAKEWLDEYSSENDLSNLTVADYKKIKRECAIYIKKNIDVEEEKTTYGSVLFVIVIGAVISWVIQRLLDEIFDGD